MRLSVQEPTRLSDSVLWDLQDKAYLSFGPSAWTEKSVPFYLTSAPLLARHFASLIAAYLSDSLQAGILDLNKPVYFLDIGAGAGRLCFQILRELESLLSHDSNLSSLGYVYIMSDIVESNLEAAEKNSYLRRYVEEGHLDFAYYNALETDVIKLRHSKKVLEPSKLENPMVAIATYLFDTIVQDLFKAEKGQVYEGRLALFADKVEKDISIDDPQIIQHLESEYSWQLIENLEDYYSHKALVNVLNEFKERYDLAHFLFPTGAFAVIERLHALSNGRCLLLAADQGGEPKHKRKTCLPALSLHSTFSLPVDYEIVEIFLKNMGGACLLAPEYDKSFVVSASVLSEKEKYPQLLRTFDQTVSYFEVVHYWYCCNELEKHLEVKNPSLHHLYLLLKQGNWDPSVFHMFYTCVEKQWGEASEDDIFLFEEALEKIWQRHFPLSKDDAYLPLNMGVLMFHVKRFDSAYRFFQRAAEIDSEFALAWHYQGLAALRLMRLSESQRCLKQAQNLDPSLIPTKST
ncbi:MAG: hypothetical protein CMO81_01230 [Waddliaceae bacterium]|nr:hypothetical protein [Waddliaceae bacterium]